MAIKHITVQGVAWDQIARERLGSEYAMHEIIARNLHLRGTLLFSGDIAVSVPEKTAETAKPPTESLPPWERQT